MEEPLYFLNESFFDCWTPGDALNWLRDGVTDEQLAEAYRIVSGHCTQLTMDADDHEDPWNMEAFDDWYEVELKLADEITERMRKYGMEICEGKGYGRRIQPFLERYMKEYNGQE